MNQEAKVCRRSHLLTSSLFLQVQELFGFKTLFCMRLKKQKKAVGT